MMDLLSGYLACIFSPRIFALGVDHSVRRVRRSKTALKWGLERRFHCDFFPRRIRERLAVCGGHGIRDFAVA